MSSGKIKTYRVIETRVMEVNVPEYSADKNIIENAKKQGKILDEKIFIQGIGENCIISCFVEN